MINPFRFGQLVSGESFCNREKELTEIIKAIDNRYSFWIYSPRRFGKTSLLLKAFENIKDTKTIYIDLYNSQSLAAFAEKYSQATLKELFDWKSGFQTAGKKISGFFKHIIPKISFDSQGNPTVSLEPQQIDSKSDIEQILEIPEKIASEKNIHVCVAFDEFQEVTRIHSFLINWMRSAFQRHQNVSYIFLGSKQSLMEEIFADSNSPFYEFGFKLPIAEINPADWTPFLTDKFNSTGVPATPETIKNIIEKSECHPHFTQYFASVVWELIREGSEQDSANFIATWMNRIIAGQSIIFQNIYDQLNQNQRKALTAIALLETGDQLFATKYRRKHKLPSSSTLTTSVTSLLKKDLITRNNGSYKVPNPILKEWLRRLAAGSGYAF
ncbi:MAG: ATP-binding protein [bacterium]|nr:ATP-binding protein [bacterium]